MNKSTNVVENNMEITNCELQKGNIKIKKDNVKIDALTQDVELRLTLKTDTQNEERQANGLHQVNGVSDSTAKKYLETSSVKSELECVASSHKNQPGKNQKSFTPLRRSNYIL